MGYLRCQSDPLDLQRRRAPSTSSALHSGDQPPTPNGSSCECGDTYGRSAIGSNSLRTSPFLGKAFAPSGADALGLCSPPVILSSAVATRRAGTLDLEPVFSPADCARSCSGLRVLLLASPRLRHPARDAAGGMTHVGRCAALVRRAPTLPWARPVRARALGRRVDGRGSEPNGGC
jgi:hypothetical protein